MYFKKTGLQFYFLVKTYNSFIFQQSCIFWPGYHQEYFSLYDLKMLKEFQEYVQKTRRQLKQEESVAQRKVSRPNGMPDLSGRYEKLQSEVWNQQVFDTNLEPDVNLVNELSHEELLQSAMAREDNEMFLNKRLNTESLLTLINPKGWLNSEVVEYFCKMLQEEYPGSMFVHLNQCLAKSEARTLHASEINVKQSGNIHFIFIRCPKMLFDNSRLTNLSDHWAMASILSDGNVIFGDSLYTNIPINLKAVLNDYYHIKFGKNITKIVNISGGRYFPKQRDGHLCGVIALMNLVLCEDEAVLRILKNNQILPSIQQRKFMIFSPSTYGYYLRQIFMTSYSDGSLNRKMFLSDKDFTLISGILNNVQTQNNRSQEKFQSVSKRKLQKMTKVSETNSKCSDVLPQKNNSNLVLEENANRYNVLGEEDNTNVQLEDVGSDFNDDKTAPEPVSESSLGAKSCSMSSSASKAGTRSSNSQARCNVDSITPTTNKKSLQTRIAYPNRFRNVKKMKGDIVENSKDIVEHAKVIVENSKDIVGNSKFELRVNCDGYSWKRKWKKNAKNRNIKNKVVWSCVEMENGKQCLALKVVSKTDFGKKKNVQYISKHSLPRCGVKPDCNHEPGTPSPSKQIDVQSTPKHSNSLTSKQFFLSTPEHLSISPTKPSTPTTPRHPPPSTEKVPDPRNIRSMLTTPSPLKPAIPTLSLLKSINGSKSVEGSINSGEATTPKETLGTSLQNESMSALDSQEMFNNDDEQSSINDNSMIEGSKKEDNEPENIYNIDGTKAATNNEDEFVIFKMRKKAIKFCRFEINKFVKKFFVENSCAVFVNGLDGTNFDTHSWKSFHGGHGIGTGITTSRCNDSTNCEMRKKKWTCIGKCPGERFCCIYFKEIKIQICLYIGKHTHEIVKDDYMDLRNYNEEDIIEKELNTETVDTANDDDSTGYISSEENDIEEENENKSIKMNKYEERIYKKCQESFEGKEIVMAKHNDIIADTNIIYILKRRNNEKIASIARDGYLYQSNTSRKTMPLILENQGFSYAYNCNGKLVCYNIECPVLNRLTVLNSFQYKKSSPNKCRFCKSELQWEECEGQKYVLRSKETDLSGNKLKYLIIKYEKKHTCGDPEPILDQNVANELKLLFENNPELSPSHAYKSLLEKKIRDRKGYQEILAVVQAFTFDHRAKNIKANVKKDIQGNGDDMACMLKLQTFLSEMPELEIVFKVYTDSYICENCDKYFLARNIDDVLATTCNSCQTDLQHTGPIILLTSIDQIRAAEQMTRPDGMFEYSTLYMDHQNNRIINFNTFNTFFYDFHIQSISSIFTVHSKFEDRYSINLSFKLFDEEYKAILKTENSFRPHGFSSDNAGAISAGLRSHFGAEVRHRTCSFHYLYGAYMHCCNAIGGRSAQVQFLRFSCKLLEAATPQMFEMLYGLFVKWIDKTESRRKKLKPWLKFWYDRKTQWATAYTSLSVNGVNLSEAGQAKYKINNGLKRLKLYQGMINFICQG